MNRREFLHLGPGLCIAPGTAKAQDTSPSPEPIPDPHFPSRLYRFVWRNWELANVDRMARVIGTTPAVVLDLGASLGLPDKRYLSEDQRARLYITVIRQNWHVLPEKQIIDLLGWDQNRFLFTLKEDDFLEVKLGRKPVCSDLIYAPPTQADKAQAAEVRAAVRELFGDGIHETGEDLFAFVNDLSDTRYHSLNRKGRKRTEKEVDLAAGWSIVADPPFRVPAERFSRYLREAMDAAVVSGKSEKTIRLVAGNASEWTGENFQIDVREKEIIVKAAGSSGVSQALYFLADRMERREAPFVPLGSVDRKAVWRPRYLYSYFALYGDPLMEPERDPFPDAYLERLARRGINGVWMQGVLNNLAPSKHFPEFGHGCETRLNNLNAFTARARQFGMRIFLYMNEPRAMPDAFFRKYPESRGASFRNVYSMCTSVPVVREWISDSLAHIFRHVPDLGGIFSITMSENHTNCFSHGGAWGTRAPNAGDCPRCSKRASWDTIGELIRTFRDGVRRQSATAEIISWDWGWGDALAERLIPLLPKDTRFMSISEWDTPVHRGGVKAKVGEYSISVVGPGPRASRNWSRAQAAGIAPMAKLQFNVTWEISAVPYIPVIHLILEHCDNLAKAGITGVMPSWTCGGYASPNLSAAKAYYFEPRPPRSRILHEVAAQRYGVAAAGDAIEAWRHFSDAFREFPYGVHVYVIPTQHGPANPLRLHATGYKPGMILFPYDAYRAWSGAYPPEIAQKQFSKLAARWKPGIEALERAFKKTSRLKRGNAELDLAIAKTCLHHFESTANQIAFYLLRDKERTSETRDRMRALAQAEIQLARRQFPIARKHSVIAYEATNHYYYTPLDLVEKVLNCRQVIRELENTGEE